MEEHRSFAEECFAGVQQPSSPLGFGAARNEEANDGGGGDAKGGDEGGAREPMAAAAAAEAREQQAANEAADGGEIDSGDEATEEAPARRSDGSAREEAKEDVEEAPAAQKYDPDAVYNGFADVPLDEIDPEMLKLANEYARAVGLTGRQIGASIARIELESMRVKRDLPRPVRLCAIS